MTHCCKPFKCGVFLALASLPIALGSAAMRMADDDPSTLSVAARAATDKFTQLTPIQISIDVKNQSTVVYDVIPDADPYELFTFVVLRNRKPVPKTLYGIYRDEHRGLRVALRGAQGLRPSKEIVCTFYPNLFYDMTLPGDYDVVVELSCINRETSKREIVRSEKLGIRIVEKK